MTSRFLSLLSPVFVVLSRGGGLYHVLVCMFLVPRVPWDLQLFVESVVFPTDPHPGAHSGADILENGGWAEQNLDFQALKTPCSWEESFLCA